MLARAPENGIVFVFHQAMEDERTIMIGNFIVQGQRGIGIGRKVYEEWQSNIPSSYTKILLRAKNDKAFAFWSKMGFASECGPNADGEHWMIKDISGLTRDARIPFLYTTSVPEEEAAQKTRHMGLSKDSIEKARSWLRDECDEIKHPELAKGLAYATTPEEDVLAAAIRQCPTCVQYLKDSPPAYLRYLAVQTDGMSIRVIKDRTRSMEMAAIKNRPDAILHVNDKTPILEFLALTASLPKGTFDVRLLAKHDEYFCDAILDRIRPGLSAIRSLYQDCGMETRSAAYEAFISSLPSNPTDICIPADIAPGETL